MDFSTEQRRAAPSTDDVTWRQLGTGLWVGRAEGHHIGMIERGRRFTLTDGANGIHPGFPTLSAAQDAATGPIAVTPSSVEPDRTPDASGVHESLAVAQRRSPLSPVSLGMIALALAALVTITGVLQLL